MQDNEQYYLEWIKALSMDAMRKALNGESPLENMFLIGLCAEAVEGNPLVIRTLKAKNIFPPPPEAGEEEETDD